MAQSKTVDVTPMKITLPVIEMSQYDLGREVIVHMKDGSEWFDMTGYTAKLQGTKPSGFGYTVTGVVDGHDVTFESNYDMTSEAGFIPSEVRLTKNGVSLGSLNVMLHVERTPHDIGTTDGSPESLIPELTVLVERAEAAAEILIDCSATATTLSTGSQATASYDVETGVFSFGLPRGAKGDDGQAGAKGDDGVGIVSITKTGTVGLVDTYTITYTNGTTSTFTVTNGQNGTGSVSDVWQNGVSVLDGNTAKITVPTKTSDLTNDSNFAVDASYVHTDNNYTSTEKSKLAGIASGAEVNVQSDWNATSGDALILNKPTIPTVPTNVSAFTNDAGYLTTHQSIKTINSTSMVGTGDVSVQPTLVSGTNIKTVNNNSLLGSGNIDIQSGSDISATQVQISVADWSATTTCTKSVTGVTASNSIIVSPDPSSITDYVSSGVYCSAQAAGTLTFECSSTPSSDIWVNVMIVG